MKCKFQLSSENPPEKIYKKALELFGSVVSFDSGVVFTVGDTIYCKESLSRDLLEHEKTHVIQQESLGWEKWWEFYFSNPSFRYEQELEAYCKQYRWLLENCKDRKKIHDYLMFFASCLSGKMYGNIVSFGVAYKEIKG